MPVDAAEEILAGSNKAGKVYAFDESHNPSVPAQTWFQESEEGLVLFVVFYSQACRWSRCLGCNLPSKGSRRHIPYKDLMAQVDAVFRNPEVAGRRASIRKVVVSNNGSILDEVTFSSTTLMYLLARINLQIPDLKVLTIESRPEYVDFAELEFIARALREGDSTTHLEIAIGFEAFDDHIRNEVFDKGLPRETFEDFVSRVAPYGYRLKCYFMQKPVPGLSDEEAIADIRSAIDYLDGIVDLHEVEINIHLNPTFVSSGTRLEKAFLKGDYFPPRLRDVARAALHARDKKPSIFIGLCDEGLAVEGGSFIRPGDEALVERLETFNRTQDYRVLEAICQDDVFGNPSHETSEHR